MVVVQKIARTSDTFLRPLYNFISPGSVHLSAVVPESVRNQEEVDYPEGEYCSDGNPGTQNCVREKNQINGIRHRTAAPDM